jgi:hypothetical protein
VIRSNSLSTSSTETPVRSASRFANSLRRLRQIDGFHFDQILAVEDPQRCFHLVPDRRPLEIERCGGGVLGRCHS